LLTTVPEQISGPASVAERGVTYEISFSSTGAAGFIVSDTRKALVEDGFILVLFPFVR
jgi:hypothetical protein